jgi:hypothetical protein
MIGQYSAYYHRHPTLRCKRQVYSAASLAAALPPGYRNLWRSIPRQYTHVHARSARSSQSLALALLGSAAARDPSLAWFWRALCVSAPKMERVRYAFEETLKPENLNERPRVTQLDFVVENNQYFAAVECKWSEAGFGICSCEREREGSPKPGAFCAERVTARDKYWLTAHEVFGLCAQRFPLFACPISSAYQAVRTAAAARHLAGSRRQAVFVLLFDSNNPYFRRTGSWPGWPTVLQETVAAQNCPGFCFRAISWQRLIGILPVPAQVRKWAFEKHRLG